MNFIMNGYYTMDCNNLESLKSEIIKDIQSHYSITRLRCDRDGDYEHDIELVIKDIKFKLEKKK